MDIETIITAVIGALGGGGVGSIIGWRAKKRQDEADAKKKEQEAKSDQIENIEKMMEKAYKPIIEDLTEQVQKLQKKVDELEADKDRQNRRIEEQEEEIYRLRAIIREVRPDLVQSRRGVNGKKAQRNPDGTFAKQREEAPTDGE